MDKHGFVDVHVGDRLVLKPEFYKDKLPSGYHDPGCNSSMSDTTEVVATTILNFSAQTFHGNIADCADRRCVGKNWIWSIGWVACNLTTGEYADGFAPAIADAARPIGDLI